MILINIFSVIFLDFILRCSSKETQNPLLLISMGGMRADKFDKFINENPSSTFKRIINNGLKADFMIPIFPTLTFPNHFSLVTGTIFLNTNLKPKTKRRFLTSKYYRIIKFVPKMSLKATHITY